MPPYRKKTSIELRTRATFLTELGVSCREVSRQLKVNVKTVYVIKKRLAETGSVADRARSGRPKKTSARQDRALVRYSLSDRCLTSPQLRQKVEAELGVTVSSSTIRKRLNSAGLCGYVAVKKPLLRPANIKSHLEFASIRTGLCSSGKQFCGQMRVPFNFSVGRSVLLCGGGLVRGTAHSALSQQ